MMVGSNLKDQQLQQIVDKTIMEADLDGDGKISFEEFTKMVENTDVSMSMTLGEFGSYTVRLLGVLTKIKTNFKTKISAYIHTYRRRKASGCKSEVAVDVVYDNELDKLLHTPNINTHSIRTLNVFTFHSGCRGSTSCDVMLEDRH